MIEEDIYTFRIDAYTPDTIPMARLAAYMAELAAMFGEKDRVHFKGLKAGSTKLLSRVEREAAPKVRNNLMNAASGEESEAAKSFKKLNEMLRDDNAEAKLVRGKSNILNFPGRKAVRPPKLGPFNQGVVRDGILVRIGGKDKSAHAIIEDGDGYTWSFEVSRELAKELAHHLFGKPLRLTGQGRWFRDEEGQWQYSSLKAAEFKVLDDASLADVVGRIRGLPKDTWKQGVDPIQMLSSLRDDGSEVN
ncbi:hypothetical protein [Pseudoxanthomonas kalamensis]|uniref:hypothetical protein n=1 Tax=Pseudoxanthomonas kalamensis TaxID=289483 RepID=UPI001390FBD4|nr:hypothetical protein [Pseudoxanthomonas kalamensis]